MTKNQKIMSALGTNNVIYDSSSRQRMNPGSAATKSPLSADCVCALQGQS